MLLDLKLVIRSLARRKWAAAGVTLSLALGIAAQLVVLSCVNAVLWKPLPVPSPAEVATVYGFSQTTGTLVNVSLPQLEELARLDAIQGVAGFSRLPLVWDSGSGVETIHIEMVTDRYFETVRPPLRLGRFPTGSGEVLLSQDFWRTRYGGTPAVIGQTLRLSGATYIVTGVMAAAYRGTLLDYMGNPKIWLSMRSQDRIPIVRGLDLSGVRAIPLFVGVARMRHGVTVDQAQAAVTAMERHSATGVGDIPRPLQLFSSERGNFHPSSRPKVVRTLALCAALATLLLLLACMSASFFLVGKALSEGRQTAMERALGGSDLRVAARRFVEAGVLCSGAFAGGSVLAAWCIDLLRAFPVPLANLVFEPTWDWRVWLLTGVCILVTVAASGLGPALLMRRIGGSPVQAVYAGPSKLAWRLREAMVALQVAMAAVILVVSGALLQSIQAAHSMDLGFRAEGLSVASVDLTQSVAAQRADVVRSLENQLRVQPGVQQVTTASLAPLETSRMASRLQTADGAVLPTSKNAVSRSYFETIELPLRRGRTFSAGQAAIGEAIVNETLAAQLAARGDALGHVFNVLDERGAVLQKLTVIGVAAAAKYSSLWQSQMPYYYVSNEVEIGGSPSVVVRGSGSGRALWTVIRDAVERVAPGAAVSELRTGDTLIAAQVREQTYLAWLFGAVAAVAMVIAATGLTANLLLMVAQRRREIGIRQALGASKGAILKGVLLRGFAIAASGLTLGLALGGRAQYWMRPLAPGTPEGDPWALVWTAAAILVVAAAAVYGPAWKASRSDPWEVLRQSE